MLLVPAFLFAAGWFLWHTRVGWDHTISDIHGFRQTQTAISVRALLQGGPFWRYETPVLGPPWSIPMELPLYQWVVAAWATLFSTDIASAGRWVGEGFFLATLAALWALLGECGVRPVHRLAFLSLALVSPEYVFWSRTLMIESTATALCVGYLWLMARHLRTRDATSAVVGMLLGSLGAAVKVTTFLPFCLVAAVMLFAKEGLPRPGTFGGWVQRTSFAAVSFGIVPLAALVGWTRYADAVKALNAWGAEMVSNTEHMRKWSFGTWSQRVDASTWAVFLARTVPDQVGSVAALGLGAAVIGLARHRLWPWLVSIVAFVFGLMVFVNLHVVHNYYAYGIGLFLVAAVGWAVVGLMESESWKRGLGAAVLAVCLVASTTTYRGAYYRAQAIDHTGLQHLGETVRRYVPPGEIFVGVGLDWSSELPYYAERRALMWPDWIPTDFEEARVKRAMENLGAARVAALVACSTAWRTPSFLDQAIERWSLSRQPAYRVGGCAIFPRR